MLNEKLLNKNEKYLVGVSGGSDSMALLDLLVSNHYQVYVCHFNYHYREDSDIDEQIVRTYCKEHQIPCFVRDGQRKDYEKGNFEMIAREMRYQFYQDIALKNHIQTIILGHHYDDFVETAIWQIQRHNTDGFLGIKETSRVKNMTIVRPLLEVTKQQLLDYNLQHNITYHEDYTNQDISYTRNYIRHVEMKNYDIDELMKRVNTHNLHFKEEMLEIEPYIKVYKEKEMISYISIPQHLLLRVLYQIIKQYVYPPYISHSLLNEIVKELASNKPNIEILLPVNFVLIKEYDNILVRQKEKEENYCFQYTKFLFDQQKHYTLCHDGHIHDGVYISEEDYPITIRTFKAGDTIKTKGGTKKVSRLFIDRKIPKVDRKTWPIVLNARNEIILIPHIAKNISYLYTKPNVFVVKLGSIKRGVYSG